MANYPTNGNDWISGTNGNDTIDALGGSDTVFGLSGNDYLYGNTGDDYLYGYDGNDTVSGGTGNDAVVGYGGNDYLYGGDGNDVLGDWYHGESGNDYLSGGAGNDTLYGYGGGTEYDTLIGGGGADKFVLGQETTSFVSGYAYYLGNGYATITDFNWAEGDKFQVFGSISDYSLNQSYNWSGGSALDTAIYYKGDLIGVVQDRSGSQVLLSADFNFVT